MESHRRTQSNISFYEMSKDDCDDMSKDNFIPELYPFDNYSKEDNQNYQINEYGDEEKDKNKLNEIKKYLNQEQDKGYMSLGKNDFKISNYTNKFDDTTKNTENFEKMKYVTENNEEKIINTEYNSNSISNKMKRDKEKENEKYNYLNFCYSEKYNFDESQFKLNYKKNIINKVNNIEKIINDTDEKEDQYSNIDYNILKKYSEEKNNNYQSESDNKSKRKYIFEKVYDNKKIIETPKSIDNNEINNYNYIKTEQVLTENIIDKYKDTRNALPETSGKSIYSTEAITNRKQNDLKKYSDISEFKTIDDKIPNYQSQENLTNYLNKINYEVEKKEKKESNINNSELSASIKDVKINEYDKRLDIQSSRKNGEVRNKSYQQKMKRLEILKNIYSEKNRTNKLDYNGIKYSGYNLYNLSDPINLNTLDSVSLGKIEDEDEKMRTEIQKEKKKLDQLEKEKMFLIQEGNEMRHKILSEIARQEREEIERKKKKRQKYEESLQRKKRDEEKLRQIKKEQERYIKEIEELMNQKKADEQKLLYLTEGRLNTKERKRYRNFIKKEKCLSEDNIIPIDINLQEKTLKVMERINENYEYKNLKYNLGDNADNNFIDIKSQEKDIEDKNKLMSPFYNYKNNLMFNLSHKSVNKDNNNIISKLNGDITFSPYAIVERNNRKLKEDDHKSRIHNTMEVNSKNLYQKKIQKYNFYKKSNSKDPHNIKSSTKKNPIDEMTYTNIKQKTSKIQSDIDKLNELTKDMKIKNRRPKIKSTPKINPLQKYSKDSDKMSNNIKMNEENDKYIESINAIKNEEKKILQKKSFFDDFISFDKPKKKVNKKTKDESNKKNKNKNEIVKSQISYYKEYLYGSDKNNNNNYTKEYN